MSSLLPLLVAIPLLAAAAITAVGEWLPPWLDDVLGILAGAAVTVLALIVLVHSEHGELLHWFGGWHGRRGVAVGIVFTVDQLGAGMAALTSFLVLAAMVFSWRFFDDVGKLYWVLVLVFLGGMNGFALTGDLFNMFVFFELMGVAAYALCGYQSEEKGPVQGALNFAISNTVGALLILAGIALVYGRTGALNLAQLGKAFDGRHPDRLVVVAFTFLLVGFLIKAAMVPFHFWLADAHAVAPSPVCVLLSGAMVPLGLLAVARIYWASFAGSVGLHYAHLQDVLVGLGLLTAVVGAVMCFLQRHLKRMLAYSTISHAGVMLIGIALLEPKGLAGAGVLVLAHGLLKGSLFLACGLLIRELGDIDELRLHGRGRGLPLPAATFFLGAIGLAGLPFVGAFGGHSLIDEASNSASGFGWLGPVLALIAIVSTAPILRGGARVFLGWGPREDALLAPQPPEREAEETENPPGWTLRVATLTLLVAGLAISLVPGLEAAAEHGAERFQDHSAYVAKVLEGKPMEKQPAVPFELRAAGKSIAYGLVGAIGAIGLAALALLRRRWTEAVLRPALVLRSLHTGVIGDYVAWIAFGTVGLGGLFALLLR